MSEHEKLIRELEGDLKHLVKKDALLTRKLSFTKTSIVDVKIRLTKLRKKLRTIGEPK